MTMIERRSGLMIPETRQFREGDVPSVKPASRRPTSREIGSTGHMITGGVLRTVDYNSEMQPPQVYDTYDKMRKSDGTVKGLMSALKLPILNVDWRMEPATEDVQDVAIAAWLEAELKTQIYSFETLLYQILLFLDYGSMPFETVWSLTEDKLITLSKLAPRLPKSVFEWHVDENGELKGIRQHSYKASTFDIVDIPADKLLVFVCDLEGSDYRGNSVLRPCYKHWYLKERFYILDAIAKERRAIGIDVGTMKGNDFDEEDERDLQTALMGLHAHEKQFMIEQEERFTYRVEGLQGRPMPLLDSIEHHDRLILRTLLAEFIGLGSEGGGSFALSRDKSSFFVMGLNSRVKYIADAFNRYLIPRWVDFNWTVKKYPKLVYSPIETRNIAALADAVTKLEEAGFLSPTKQDEAALRDALELPVRRNEESTGIPLNGAHLNAITTLFQKVGEGMITLDQAKGIIKASFPFLPQEMVDTMIGASENV